ncbi:class I SAM-dependent methyltransferase [Jeotgalibaca sp. A122]|uniref:class I SAM-dependent methyltransferase n=1 Tax=Jeotgalibaca sp. A122 TaxID=3457322 RepID=UPI003FD07539
MNRFDEIAGEYDEDIYPLNEKEFVTPTVEKLAELAPGNDVLELAVGTGRIAIPLAERGFQVTGMDISEGMLQELHKKSDRVKTLVGDMRNVAVDAQFDLVYLIFNGITYALTLDDQVATIQNAARHLRSGGVLVIETFVPRVHEIVGDNRAPFALEEDFIGYDEYDRVNQKLISKQFDLSEDQVASHQTEHRYVWPSELELMGRLAGLEVAYKWGDWTGEALTNDSDDMIIIFRKK